MIKELLRLGYLPESKPPPDDCGFYLSKEILSNFELKDIIRHLLGIKNLSNYFVECHKN
jgi:hypothetical protein